MGLGSVGSIAILMLTKYKLLAQFNSFKLEGPEILVPCPIIIEKIPSDVDRTLKLSL